MSESDQQECLRQTLNELRVGPLLSRLSYCLTWQAIVQQTNLVYLCERSLFHVLFPRRRKRANRRELTPLLRSLHYLHICDGHEPNFGDHTSLLTYFRDRNNPSLDECPPKCVGSNNMPHSHIVANLGLGFFGCLTEMASESTPGQRQFQFHSYEDSREEKQRKDELQKRVGGSGHLTQLYVPMALAMSSEAPRLKTESQVVLNTVHREMTRGRRKKRGEPSAPNIIIGDQVPPVQANAVGRSAKQISCPSLDSEAEHIEFNGNGPRKGRGYRLATWARKSGLDPRGFLAGCKQLAEQFGLIVVGISKNGQRWYPLDELRSLERRRPHVASDIHVRFYVKVAAFEHWERRFGWPIIGRCDPSAALVDEINFLLDTHGVKRRELAVTANIHPSTLSRILNGSREWRNGLLECAKELVQSRIIEDSVLYVPTDEDLESDSNLSLQENSHGGCHEEIQFTLQQDQRWEAVQHDRFAAAQFYLDLGWSIIPQRTGEKKPLVKWTEFQTRKPTPDELSGWWQRWPDAGIMLVLGPASGVFTVDVDGKDAHDVLNDKIPDRSHVPCVKSGSEDPYRYHLHFEHPVIETKARKTPWHPQLEFRGHGGLVVLPPSFHRSGRQYVWDIGGPPLDGVLPKLPTEITEAIQQVRKVQTPTEMPLTNIDGTIPVGRATRELLSERYANVAQWNNRLFQAACDLCGLGIPIDVATQRLIEGAKPVDEQSRSIAILTIKSAYKIQRERSYVR
ncbi:bifunctional DNA primase/polymerase [Roseiconus lacunae]|uniref:bifunctional DNA primase/polymerase n=1 Tax=Roseiconus lacunae TaxID=2605694 RepID=UPI001E470078|nr:bifunctional DNA primase/polymerase [Roseiconus lacunae]MCD0458614.1 bifunctional DNA primase/polymerase [Roseiconus lacunae]